MVASCSKLEHLGAERANVIGHSMGGMLAVRFALMFADRVEKLALINPIGLEDWKRVVPCRTIDEWYENELKITPDQQRKYQMESYYHGEWKPDYERWVQLATGWLKSPEYPTVAWNSALSYDMIFTQPVCYEFADLVLPTLLVVGSLDRTAIGKQWVSAEIRDFLGVYPKLAKKAASEIPECELEILEGIGHVPQIEASSLLRALETIPGLLRRVRISVVPAFDRDKTNIVVEIGSRRERERFFENGIEEFSGRKACIAK